MTEGRLGRWIVSRDKCDTAGGSATIPHRGRATRRPTRRYGARHDAQHTAWDKARQHARGRSDTVGGTCDTTKPGLRHGRARPATRPGQAYDTAQCARRLGQGWVHCALDSVLTQCTVLSHYLGTLFMSIVHEVLKNK